VRFQIVGSGELGLTKVAFVSEFFRVQGHVFQQVTFSTKFFAAVGAFQRPDCMHPGMRLKAVFSLKKFWAKLTLQGVYHHVTADI